MFCTIGRRKNVIPFEYNEWSTQPNKLDTQINFVVQNQQAKEALEQSLPRLRELLMQQGLELGESSISYGDSSPEQTMMAGMKLAELLRESIPGVRVMNHFGGGNFKKQFKRADKLSRDTRS